MIKNKGKPLRSKIRGEFIHRWNSGSHSQSVYENLILGVTKDGSRAKTSKLADRDMHMISPDFPINVGSKCCTYLKKKPFEKYAKQNELTGTIIGLRMDEGGARLLNTQRRILESGKQKICTAIDKKGHIKKTPIIDWTDKDVEEFIKEYNVPLSRAYTEYGLDRTGCMGCPFSEKIATNLWILHEFEPNRYKASMHWLKDVYIAQNVKLPFDEAYEREREREWETKYEPMRQEMLRKYRPNSKLIKDHIQLSIFGEEI